MSRQLAVALCMAVFAISAFCQDAAFRSALSADNAVLRIPAGNYVVSPLVIEARKHVSVMCESGAILTNANGPVFVVDGSSDIHVSGCSLHAGGYSMTVTNSRNVGINENSSDGFMYVSNSQYVEIADNDVGGIFAEDNILAFTARDNVAHISIMLHTVTPGAFINIATVSGNTIIGAGSEFCIEIGAFSSDHAPLSERPQNLVVSKNNCVLVSDTMYGGYSFSQIMKYSITGNNYDRNGCKAGLPGLELVSADNGTVSGNTLTGGDLSIDGSSDVVVSGNSASALFMTTSRNADVSRNRVTSNRFESGLRFQCNFAGSIDCSNNLIAENTFVNGNGSSDQAIVNENDYPKATMKLNVYTLNHLLGFKGACFGDSGSNTQFLNNFSDGCTKPAGH